MTKSTAIGRKCSDCGYYGTPKTRHNKREWCHWLGKYRNGNSEECEDGFKDKVTLTI